MGIFAICYHSLLLEFEFSLQETIDGGDVDSYNKTVCSFGIREHLCKSYDDLAGNAGIESND